ncbi:family 43 glycosylhydrolase [Alistipes intestinihominis]|uniref:Family 43 glycosylhydrolase n=1 Tax=Alistipes intestinihominis TaxID=3133172 RepID=A0ABV1GYU5_9BACT
MRTDLFLFLTLSLAAITSCDEASGDRYDPSTYKNPVTTQKMPDPTVIRDGDTFYLYATEAVRNVPIMKSRDLVNWTLCGTVFSEATRPDFTEGGEIWAPDINYVGDRYLLYYSLSSWGGIEDCGIGVAEAETPEGPWINHGKLFISKEIGCLNSIDPFFIEEDGAKYLFWGSFRGIWGARLSDNGLTLDTSTIQLVAGTAFEATYIHKRGNYYYLFASTGSCCSGLNSTYSVVVGRSENLFGPYVDRNGEEMLSNHYETVLKGNGAFAGPGHNAEIVTDRDGTDWLLYHAYWVNSPSSRTLMLDRVNWTDGWPLVNDGYPSNQAASPRL